MHGPAARLFGGGYGGGGFGVLAGLRSLAMRMVSLESRHRLRQLDLLHLLPPSIRRFLVDEHLPGPSVTLVPRLALRDFARLMETPTRDTLEYWILRGERSVWPAVAALRVRCAIEMELDRAYQDVRRLKAGGLRRKGSEVAAQAQAQAQARDQIQAKAKAQEKAQEKVQGQAQTQARARVPGGRGDRNED
jgi:TAG lipase/lysophosphatidylethanolamine acyltransferase